jgi:prophage regulatory protein
MEPVVRRGIPQLVVRPTEIERVVGLSRPTVYRFEREGHFPKRRQLGPRATGWLLGDLQDWLRSRPESSPRPESRRSRGVDDAIGL